jgi:anti-sigma B factor antagonist
VKVRKHNDVAVIHPHGWLMGGDETEEFENTIRRLHAEGTRHLLVNMAEVQMMNSTAIGVLTGCRARFAATEGQIVLCNLDKKLDQIFVITRLALIFDVYASEKEALEAMAQPVA